MKPSLTVVLIGEVDHGKSSLVGRLLDETGALSPAKIAAVKRICESQGKEFEYAFLLDAFEEEQRQGITIDVSYIQFSTALRNYKLIDAPGHREFLKNMMSGSSSAEAAILLIDAQQGIHEQSRRHSYLTKLIGIEKIIVAVNKMDLVEYSETVFNSICNEHHRYLHEIGISNAQYIPLSARTGANITKASQQMPWYKGDSLLQALEKIPFKTSDFQGSLRLPVQDVYKFDQRRILAGRIEAGQLRVGSKLKILPSNAAVEVTSIEKWNSLEQGLAQAGESVGITIQPQVFAERGDILVHENEDVVPTTAFNASIFWMSQRPLQLSQTYKIKLLTQELDCQVHRINRIIDTENLQTSSEGKTHVNQYEVAEVTIKTSRPMMVDLFKNIPHAGRFVLSEQGLVAGGGIVTGISQAKSSEVSPQNLHTTIEFSDVKPQDRAKKNGHRGAIIWLTGLSGSGKSLLAKTIEARLFQRGSQVFVLDGDNIRNGLSRDLGFSKKDRIENIRRVGEVAKLLAESGQIVITAFISPFERDRKIVRELMSPLLFYEVYLQCPIEICEKRDPKNLYKRARAGELAEFTGISSPFEEPLQPELKINSHQNSREQCAQTLLQFIDQSEIFKCS